MELLFLSRRAGPVRRMRRYPFAVEHVGTRVSDRGASGNIGPASPNQSRVYAECFEVWAAAAQFGLPRTDSIWERWVLVVVFNVFFFARFCCSSMSGPRVVISQRIQPLLTGLYRRWAPTSEETIEIER